LEKTHFSQIVFVDFRKNISGTVDEIVALHVNYCPARYLNSHGLPELCSHFGAAGVLLSGKFEKKQLVIPSLRGIW